MVPMARDLQIVDSTLSVVGGDVHNHYHHSEHIKDLWGLLRSIPNFRNIYQDMLSKATPGTGMWLLKGDKFRLWLEPNGDIKIFWGSGIPGAGKTLLACIVIECLEALCEDSDVSICVCYVFFRYSDRSEVTVRNVLEILIKQTLERHPDCLTLVEQTYARHLRESTDPTEAQLIGLLRKLVDRISCTFYILDALDEAPTKIQLAVVETLASLNVKLFITSRPLKTVEASFPQAHTINIVAQTADLDLHISQGISRNAELRRLLQVNPFLREEIFSAIKRNCGGMFLHASLQLDALCECLSAQDVRDTLIAFPSSIKDVYRQTWTRISKQSPKHTSLAKLVLVWVLYASRPMTIEELERAVAASPETHKYEGSRLVPGTTLTSLCRGLITVEEDSRLVRLVHYTAKDTLERLLRDPFPHPHSVLASVCMTHLARCGFQNTTISSKEQFEITLKDDPLLAYASEAWAFHACAGLDVEETKRQTAKFVSASNAFPAYTSLDHAWSFDIFTPLHLVGLYHLPLVLMEDTSIVNPNVTTRIRQWSPLAVASWSGYEALVARLITLSETKVNWSDVNGWSALMLAAHRGHEGVTKLLLEYPGIQVQLVTNHGSTALLIAAQHGHGTVIELLLAAGDVDINALDNDGDAAIKMAAGGGHEAVIRLLLNVPNIDTTIRSHKDGHTAMSAAQANGHSAIVELLQEFESRMAIMACPPMMKQLSVRSSHDEDASDADSSDSDVYHDAEEGLEGEGAD